MSQQPVHHNGMWWSRDPSSGAIHYYDEPEGAWKRWDSASSQASPPSEWRSAPPAYPNSPPQYGGYQQPIYVQSRTNGMAIASLVLGILWLWWLGSILALVFGYVAKNQIDRASGQESGRGMAIAGIVLGWIGVGTLALLLGLIAVGATQSGG